MFEKFSVSAVQVIEDSKLQSARLQAGSVGSEHLLLALTKQEDSIAAGALSTMGIYFDNVDREAQQILAGSAFGHKPLSLLGGPVEKLGFTKSAHKAMRLADEHRRNFGSPLIEPEHLLLGLVDLQEAAAVKILEELGANTAYLWRQILMLMSRNCCAQQTAPTLKSSLRAGIRELVHSNEDAVFSLKRLAEMSNSTSLRLPGRGEIVQMVILGYLPEFLGVQVAFQRYLLQESLNLLQERSGALDSELVATIVSSAAQNLRLEVRASIEYLWSHEYRMLSQMLDEAEHDLIGSEIEDIWWAQSEEMALYELFDAALDDHRRKHVLSLQKRRMEISQRLTKLRARLKETIQQCLVKRSISA